MGCEHRTVPFVSVLDRVCPTLRQGCRCVCLFLIQQCPSLGFQAKQQVSHIAELLACGQNSQTCLPAFAEHGTQNRTVSHESDGHALSKRCNPCKHNEGPLLTLRACKLTYPFSVSRFVGMILLIQLGIHDVHHRTVGLSQRTDLKHIACLLSS